MQRASASLIGRDTVYGTIPRGIGFAREDTVQTGEELHVVASTPVQRFFPLDTRLVVCLASITLNSRELGLSHGTVRIALKPDDIELAMLSKDSPQQIIVIPVAGYYEFKFLTAIGAPALCATVAVALAE
jgi:hypothetical protein